ncbi:Metacaspase-1 [Pestalotiopsis fici W106-1]|uniref:Metacaspase-1 n=1 Tax=Pestalotiopsis fici (strain W106-1 / CGMCC3.15140) TaxID=1229662 RepID=W3WXM8_PESFW|nr:Metacaspase-1 [Pestalotiopsis fici W106-1]ETS78595.1 Metacaspase-1 [Pestalotiopsis fici W106-1]
MAQSREWHGGGGGGYPGSRGSEYYNGGHHHSHHNSYGYRNNNGSYNDPPYPDGPPLPPRPHSQQSPRALPPQQWQRQQQQGPPGYRQDHYYQQHHNGPPQYNNNGNYYPGSPPPPFQPPQGYDPYGYPPPHQQRQPPPPPQQFGGYGGNVNAAPVPQTPQHFGEGAPAGYNFQYSNCSGKRKALLVGINYIGQKNQLRGCINDVRNLSAFLIERYNYKAEDMVILTDDQSDPVRQPTKANIIRAMQWLVQGAQPNDSLFLHFSGHGGQTEDLDGDEDDGFDEVIYPVDYKVAGHIVDDDIHDIVVKPLMPGVRLTAIFDSCHSGTAMDLPYVYSTKGVLKEPNLASEAGQGALSAISAYASGDIGGVISSVMGFANKALRGNDGYYKTIQTKTSPADVVMFSGSKDDQTSADAMIAQQATGAMSWAFITALKQNPRQSYVQLLNSIRDVLATKYSQKPQLSCSHPLGMF